VAIHKLKFNIIPKYKHIILRWLPVNASQLKNEACTQGVTRITIEKYIGKYSDKYIARPRVNIHPTRYNPGSYLPLI